MKYVFVELERGVRTKHIYEPGESREKVDCFVAFEMGYDAVSGKQVQRPQWDIAREGDTVICTKGSEVVHFPWSRVASAIPMPLVKR